MSQDQNSNGAQEKRWESLGLYKSRHARPEQIERYESLGLARSQHASAGMTAGQVNTQAQHATGSDTGSIQPSSEQNSQASSPSTSSVQHSDQSTQVGPQARAGMLRSRWANHTATKPTRTYADDVANGLETIVDIKVQEDLASHSQVDGGGAYDPYCKGDSGHRQLESGRYGRGSGAELCVES